MVTKAGKQTHGLDYFFSSLRQKAVPGLSFFTLSLVSIKQRRSYPIGVEPMIRTEEEKAASKAKKEAKKAKPAHPKRKPGRPKGSRNKNKADVILNPELQRIQKMLRSFLNTIQGTLQLTYLVLDGHLGNHPAFHMVRQCQLHLISKLRYDAALHFAYSGASPKRGPTPRLGEQVDVRKIPDQYLKETQIEDGWETRTYQMQLLHKDFPDPLNVVILLRTNLATQAWANVILCSRDLELLCDKLIDYDSLRFQIEFNFRDAKPFWGLEDFMHVTPTAVTNAANLALFMTDVFQLLMCQYRQDDPKFSILDLKADYRSYRYVTETIQMLP